MRLSRDPRARRRLAALAGAGGIALAAGVAVGAGDGDSPPAEPGPPGAAVARSGVGSPAPEAAAPRSDFGAAGSEGAPASRGRSVPAIRVSAETLARARRLPLERLAGQAVILRFAGYPAPGYVERALRDGLAAGAILFRDNAPTQAAARAVTRRLQRAAGGDAVVCTDQEGGAVRTMFWAPSEYGQPAQRGPARAAAAARATAKALRRAGVTLNLAPVADVATQGSVFRGRTYPGGAADVSRNVGAAVRAYRRTRVAAAVKHFPGLGAATGNTDDRPVTIDRSARGLSMRELAPFRAAIAAGAPVVMVSHARYPALDPNNMASQSPKIVDGLLRRDLRFGGVVITDSLEAEAVRAYSGPGQAAVRSVRAGVDLILTTGPGSHLRVVRALMAEARRSDAFRERLTAAAARVMALASK